jgi:hypothetical protein
VLEQVVTWIGLAVNVAARQPVAVVGLAGGG